LQKKKLLRRTGWAACFIAGWFGTARTMKPEAEIVNRTAAVMLWQLQSSSSNPSASSTSCAFLSSFSRLWRRETEPVCRAFADSGRPPPPAGRRSKPAGGPLRDVEGGPPAVPAGAGGPAGGLTTVAPLLGDDRDHVARAIPPRPGPPGRSRPPSSALLQDAREPGSADLRGCCPPART